MTSVQTTLSSNKKYLISAVILAGSVGLCVLMVMLKQPPADREVVNLTGTVTVLPAEPFDGSLNIEVSGVVEPHREVKLSAQVSGEIAEKSPESRAGNFVREGDLLMTIDPRDYELEIDRLNAELAQSEAVINELNDELTGLERSREILQKDYDLQLAELARRRSAKSALSQSELDQAQRDAMAVERTLIELQNSIRLSNTRKVRLSSGIDLSNSMLDKAKLNLQRTRIVAPFDGVIVSDPVEEGDFVRVGDPLLVYEDTSKADVKCSLRGRQVLQILKYQVPDSRFQTDPLTAAYQLPPTPVKIVAQSGDDTVQWEGILQRFDGIGFDEQTKMIPVRVVVDDPVSDWIGRPVALVRQMFVNVVISLDTAGARDEVLLVIPEVALQPGNFVWSVVETKMVDGVLEHGLFLKRHRIQILDRLDANEEATRRRVVIRDASGELKSGSPIVVTPLAQPNPGTAVRIQPPDESELPVSVGADQETEDLESGETFTTRPGELKEEPASARVDGESKRS